MRKFLVPWSGFCFVSLYFCDFQKNPKWDHPYLGAIFTFFSFVYWFFFVSLCFPSLLRFSKKSKMGSPLPLYYILLSIPLCAGFPFVFLCFFILDFLKNPIWKIQNDGRGGGGPARKSAKNPKCLKNPKWILQGFQSKLL